MVYQLGAAHDAPHHGGDAPQDGVDRIEDLVLGLDLEVVRLGRWDAVALAQQAGDVVLDRLHGLGTVGLEAELQRRGVAFERGDLIAFVHAVWAVAQEGWAMAQEDPGPAGWADAFQLCLQNRRHLRWPLR